MRAKPELMNKNIDFVLRLRPLTTGWQTEPVQRLRLALKCLGRGFGLRTVSCKPVVSTTAQPSSDEYDHHRPTVKR